MVRPAGSGQTSTSTVCTSGRAPKRRGAAPKTRSRNGCSACKTRRLKCDETKPACLACVKGNRPCPGYRKAFRWSTKHEASRSTVDDGVHELPYAEVNSALNVLSSPVGHDQPRQSSPETTAATISLASPTDTHRRNSDTASQQLPLSVEADESPSGFDDFIIDDLDPALEDATVDAWDIQDAEMLPLLPDERPGEDSYVGGDLMVVPFSHMHSNEDRSMQNQGMIPRGLNDYSTLLVEEWFKHVCPMFSCFDSDANLNRKLVQESWTRSAAMNSSLQSMAAICLATQMPYMRRVAASHLNNAILAIETELQLVHSTEVPPLNTDLLLALCCVGTTACWVNTSDTVTHYLKEAKALFRRALRSRTTQSPAEAQRMQYFNDSLVYWNMLVSVVSDADSEADVSGISPKAMSSKIEQSQVIPHPWTGTSATAQALLGRAIRLCRLFRLRFKRPGSMKMTALSLEAALGEIRQAQQIEEELLALEHLTIDRIMETGDELSPRAHFCHVAEAYRLASLLQLYQTFPDLVTRRLPEQVTDSSGCVPWDKWIVPLCLRLVDVLRQIPVSSGTRCIQPLLYITACTGLRFDQAVLAQSQEDLVAASPPQSADEFPILNTSTGVEPLQLLFGLGFNEDLPRPPNQPSSAATGAAVVTALSLEVTHARQFILGRLGILEYSLPPAPIRVAQDLVKAVWAAYDADRDPAKYTHWIDIMERSNLRTIFG
ncbi:fungal-specific transcription factor domain-domain-containing protein [Microdochium bolleyi]|uniref:Fungal-specific transcription factor domain-domain-containing protein n=1 Tax=Microdochium bolleyi TaxID=196109 RepID=A0A136INU6_9PEZI|nr:fungal-specific transcription factor domain-domain-containing protein [Microdochium bolleyi]